jgi:hypothetical protein
MKITEFHNPQPHIRIKTARLYFSYHGETIMDDLQNRRNRPQKVLRTLLPAICQHYSIEPTHAVWSQYAGCSCPCSPGFILYGVRGKNFFVTVEKE